MRRRLTGRTVVARGVALLFLPGAAPQAQHPRSYIAFVSFSGACAFSLPAAGIELPVPRWLFLARLSSSTWLIPKGQQCELDRSSAEWLSKAD